MTSGAEQGEASGREQLGTSPRFAGKPDGPVDKLERQPAQRLFDERFGGSPLLFNFNAATIVRWRNHSYLFDDEQACSRPTRNKTSPMLTELL